MPADAIIRVERLTRRSPNGIIFGDRLNTIIPDDPTDDVANDPDYDPADDNNGDDDDHVSITGVNNDNNSDHNDNDNNITGVNINENDDGSDRYPIGFKIHKTFDGVEHEGTITAYDATNQLYQIDYDDGDQEEFYHNEVNQHLTEYSNVITTDFKIQKSDNDTEYCNFVNSVQFLD